MVASRNRPKGARVGPFGLCVLVLGGVPTSIGHQDLAALLVRQHDVMQRAREYAIASPFGTIHAATFHFPRPVGTLIPEPPLLRPVSLNGGDVTGSLGAMGGAVSYPVVNRRMKGDRLALPRPPEPPAGPTRDRTPGRVKTVSIPRPDVGPEMEMPAGADTLSYSREVLPAPEDTVIPDAVAIDTPKPQADAAPAAAGDKPDPGAIAEPDTVEAPAIASAVSDSAEAPGAEVGTEAASQTYSLASLPPEPARLSGPARLAADPSEDEEGPLATQVDVPDPIDELDPVARATRLYFGGAPVGKNVGGLQDWPDDRALLIVPPHADPDIKQAALTPPGDTPDGPGGETVAPKGEVTGPEQRPKSPAERLGLTGKARAKAEKCLANAVYFESRGEPKRGQIGVAQVVMNRVFSGYYPEDVCGVVYQNAHRYNACQFTFACDSVRDVVNEPELWQQATQIARDTLDGKLWLREIGKSTHYHAYWVHPWWVRTMNQLTRIGVHKFYRPKRWGDGADAPSWGPGAIAEKAGAAKL
jgi:spore germination cell wall hydrolase CwlJ-like protein